MASRGKENDSTVRPDAFPDRHGAESEERGIVEETLPFIEIMRLELFYNPLLLLERLAEISLEHRRRWRLRGTCADWLTQDHIDTMELIDLAARGGARVLYDIGANVGTWTLLARSLVPDSEIVAFEPMPLHIEQFNKNTNGLKNIRLLTTALGCKVENRAFFPASFSDASSFLPLSQVGRDAWGIQNQPPINLPITTLDAVVESEKLVAPDLLKMDVQGFELAVLQGAAQTLRSARWVLSEVCFREYYEGQASFADIVGTLHEANFEMFAASSHARRGVELTTADVLFRKRSDSQG